jgi:hypothetical protein
MNAEAMRQQALMAAILLHDDGASLHTLIASRPAGVQRGLQAYQANAGASAERALAASFPTVRALVGEEAFASLSRAHWHARAPERGDLAHFGAELAAFIEANDQLADVPYLADVARLDWHLAVAERAADAACEPESLQRLGDTEPARLRLVLMPGVAVLSSGYPVASLWAAHQAEGAEAQARARAMLAAGEGEHALVWRDGWRARAEAIDAATARWMHGLLAREPLAAALEGAGDGFVFEHWLVRALQQQWLWRATVD